MIYVLRSHRQKWYILKWKIYLPVTEDLEVMCRCSKLTEFILTGILMSASVTSPCKLRTFSVERHFAQFSLYFRLENWTDCFQGDILESVRVTEIITISKNSMLLDRLHSYHVHCEHHLNSCQSQYSKYIVLNSRTMEKSAPQAAWSISSNLLTCFNLN